MPLFLRLFLSGEGSLRVSLFPPFFLFCWSCVLFLLSFSSSLCFFIVPLLFWTSFRICFYLFSLLFSSSSFEPRSTMPVNRTRGKPGVRLLLFHCIFLGMYVCFFVLSPRPALPLSFTSLVADGVSFVWSRFVPRLIVYVTVA